MMIPTWSHSSLLTRRLGKEIKLDPASEEVATFFAPLADAQHGQNPIFQKNFFRDFTAVLKLARKGQEVRTMHIIFLCHFLHHFYTLFT